MDDVFNLKNNTHYVASKRKTQDLLQKALQKAKSRNGIDYYKVITGDEIENQKLRMLQHQERLNNHRYD